MIKRTCKFVLHNVGCVTAFANGVFLVLEPSAAIESSKSPLTIGTRDIHTQRS